MSNYARQVDFSAKDSLPTGSPNKVVRGLEVDAELDAVQTAVNSKQDSGNFVTIDTAQTITGDKVFGSMLRADSTLNVQNPTPQANGSNVSIAAKYTLAVEEIAPSAVGVDTIWFSTNGINGTLSYYAAAQQQFIQNVAPIQTSLPTTATDVLGLLSIVRFEWKPGVWGHDAYPHDYGVVAEDLESIIPQAVAREQQPGGRPDMVSVRDRTLIMFLIAAVKELSERLDALEP
jgi:hypothetical protein